MVIIEFDPNYYVKTHLIFPNFVKIQNNFKYAQKYASKIEKHAENMFRKVLRVSSIFKGIECGT